MLETLPNNADWNSFKTPILQEILRIQNLHQVEHCAFLEVIHFVPISRMCKKQTSVSHSSTESEITAWDAGLRMDGKPALDLWDLIVAVLHGNTHQNDQVRGDPYKSPTRKKTHGIIDLDKVDFIQSNVNSSRREALLYVFADNEAVIKMIIKDRSPTRRNVSRTHRVALDWLFDRINLDPKIQFKYIDTKNRLADILTKGNFTRDEWNHLLCLFNISHFSSINSLEAMSKRTQEDAGEERVTAKPKPMMNLVSRCRVRDPIVLASTASESPGITQNLKVRMYTWARWTEQQSGTGRPVMLASSSNCSEWNIDDKWSSQERKSGEMSKTSTVRPENDKFVINDDRSEGFPRTRITKRSCACDCRRWPVSVGAFFFLSFLFFSFLFFSFLFFSFLFFSFLFFSFLFFSFLFFSFLFFSFLFFSFLFFSFLFFSFLFFSFLFFSFLFFSFLFFSFLFFSFLFFSFLFFSFLFFSFLFFSFLFFSFLFFSFLFFSFLFFSFLFFSFLFFSFLFFSFLFFSFLFFSFLFFSFLFFSFLFFSFLFFSFLFFSFLFFSFLFFSFLFFSFLFFSFLFFSFLFFSFLFFSFLFFSFLFFSFLFFHPDSCLKIKIFRAQVSPGRKKLKKNEKMKKWRNEKMKKWKKKDKRKK